jgi:hypothetical protein
MCRASGALSILRSTRRLRAGLFSAAPSALVIREARVYVEDLICVPQGLKPRLAVELSARSRALTQRRDRVEKEKVIFRG